MSMQSPMGVSLLETNSERTMTSLPCRLTSLGDAYVCDGIRLCRELSLGGRSMEERLRSGLNLEEASVCLEDFTCFRVKERVVKSIKSLVSKRSVGNSGI